MLFSAMPENETNDSDFSPAPFDPLAQKLFKARTVIISGEINQQVAERTMTQLLALAADSDAQITVYINSQGGHVEAGDTIHDMLRYIAPPVRVVGTGWVASAGALIYVAVPRAHRYRCRLQHSASCCTSQPAWHGRHRIGHRHRGARDRCGCAND